MDNQYNELIKALKKSEKQSVEIKKSEEKYRHLFEKSPVGIYITDRNGLILNINQACLNLLGYESSDLLCGKSIESFFVNPEDWQQYLDVLNKNRFIREFETSFFHQNKKILDVKMTATMRSSLTGKLSGYEGFLIDITTAKQAELQIRDLSRKLIAVIEEERKSLAADLHDEFGQTLTSLQFDMEKLQKKYLDESKEGFLLCNRVITKISDLAETIRTFTSKLRPDILDHLGLVPTLEWYIKDFKNHMPAIQINFQAMGFKRRLAPQIEIVLYRIFQESVNNTLKHSKADLIDIKLTYSHPKIIFIARDNGCGFEGAKNGFPKNITMGIGLLSMKERTNSLDGKFELKSIKGKGTIVRVELPVQ